MCMCTRARFSWLPSPFLKLIWKGIYETTKSLPTYHCQMHRSPAFIIRFLPLFLLLTRFHRFSFILDPQGKRNIVIYCNKEKRNLGKTVESKIAFSFFFFLHIIKECIFFPFLFPETKLHCQRIFDKIGARRRI